MIAGYWGDLEPPAGEPTHRDHLPTPRETIRQYPYGAQSFRIGDEAQAAPDWMAPRIKA